MMFKIMLILIALGAAFVGGMAYGKYLEATYIYVHAPTYTINVSACRTAPTPLIIIDNTSITSPNCMTTPNM